MKYWLFILQTAMLSMQTVSIRSQCESNVSFAVVLILYKAYKPNWCYFGLLVSIFLGLWTLAISQSRSLHNKFTPDDNMFFCFFFGYLRNTLQNTRELRSHSLKKWMSKCTNNSCPKLKHSYHLLLQIQEPRIVQSTLSSKSLYFHCAFLALAIMTAQLKKK